MIRCIQLQNFCSFRDKASLDLTAGAKLSADDSFVVSRTGEFVSVLSGVFGPNASGKTNLLKAFAFTQFMLRQSYKAGQPGNAIPLDSFVTRQHEPTRIMLEFESGTGLYRYELVLNSERVLAEKLMRRNEQTKHFRTLLARDDRNRLSQSSGGFTDLPALRALLKDRPDASMFAAGLLTGRPEFERVNDALGVIETNVDRAGKTGTGAGGRLNEVLACADYFSKNPHLMEDVAHRLMQADLGISGFVIKEVEMADAKGLTKRLPVPFVQHQSPDGDFEMNMMMESSGTRRIFTLLRNVLPVLTAGGVAVVDELESDLHPHLIPLMLDLFVDCNSNPKRAQLIFTCHQAEIMNHLAKEQIVLVEKDDQNVSAAYRLSDIKGVRREENFQAHYNAGRYAAIPEPRLL